MVKDLITKNRSYRRFDNSFAIPMKDLEDLIDLARLSSSASNRQLLRFHLVNSRNECEKVFANIKWAGYLTEWEGPSLQERPTAYIVFLKPLDSHSYIGHDTGIAAQSILLGAVEKGLGGCMFGSVDRKNLLEELKLPNQYEIEIVIALGKPVEKIQIDDWNNKSIRYWRDDKQVHHVPKLGLKDLIIK